MEVILRQAVEKLGHPGDIVKVSAGYGRNYLVPRGFAYEATAGNRKRSEEERQRLEQAEESRRGSASELATRLEQVSLTFSARVGDEGKLFGSGTSSDTAHQPAAEEFKIEKRQMELQEPIRALGVYKVQIRLHADVH